MKKIVFLFLFALAFAAPAAAEDVIFSAYVPQMVRSVDAAGFVHPGITVDKTDLERMQRHVRAGDEPWATAFREFAALPKSARDPRVHYGDAADEHDYENITDEFVALRLRLDSDTCFAQTIMWYITGDDVYRGNAMNIIRLWSGVKSIVHDDNRYMIDNEQLHFGVGIYKLTFAAEILRHSSYSRVADFVWSDADQAAFENLLALSYPKYNRWWHFMNQHGINNMAFMASAIFRGDAADFAKAVERTTVNKEYLNPRSGSIMSVIREVEYNGVTNLQHCEMGRDQGHAYGDIGALSVLAMTAERQHARVDPVTGELTQSGGVSLFEFGGHRLLFGGNYISKYNLGYDVPYLPVQVDEKTGSEWYYSINDTNRGLLYPNIGILYNYYKYELGRDMAADDIKYLARAYELMLPEGESEDFLGCSTLLFSGEAALGTTAAQAITPDTAYRKQLENRTRAVIEGDVEPVYGNFPEAMGFLRFEGSGTVSFVTDDFYPAYGSLSLRLRTDSPARVEVYNSDMQSAPFAVFSVPATGEWLTVAEPMAERAYWQRMTYFKVITDGRAELDWVEFSQSTALPTAEIACARAYTDGGCVYMQSGAQYVLTVNASGPYELSGDIPMVESEGFAVLRPSGGDGSVFVTVAEAGRTRCYCLRVRVFETVDELISMLAVNHRSGGDYTAGSMRRFLAAAQALRAAGPATSAAFVAAAENLARADSQNRLAVLPESESEAPILHYDFARASGGKIADISPFGNDGASVGAAFGGGELVLSGGAYVLMPEGLLAGSEAVTVSATFTPRTELSYAWLWCFANSSENGYMFFGPNRPDGNSYAAITAGSYSAESSVSGSGVPAGRRVTATLVHDGRSLLLYFDGYLAAVGRAALTPAELGSTAMNYIGRSAFISDPYFEGSVYDFRVYNRALTAAEVLASVPADAAPMLELKSFTRSGSVYAYSLSCPYGADIYAALYDVDGTLLSVCRGESGSLSGGGAAMAKFFAWESGSLRPVAILYKNILP